jgi:hypothetical protein
VFVIRDQNNGGGNNNKRHILLPPDMMNRVNIPFNPSTRSLNDAREAPQLSAAARSIANQRFRIGGAI